MLESEFQEKNYEGQCHEKMAQFLYFKIQRMRHHQVTAGNQTSHVVHRSPCLVYFLALVFKRLNVDHSVHTAMSPKKTHQIPQLTTY